MIKEYFCKCINFNKVVEKIISEFDITKPGVAVFLYGDLGAGKTYLSKSIITKITSHTEVTSPTFSLIETYSTDFCNIYHMDLYRLQSIEEINELGLDEMLSNGVFLIEWPQLLENYAKMLFKKVIYVKFLKNKKLRCEDPQCKHSQCKHSCCEYKISISFKNSY